MPSTILPATVDAVVLDPPRAGAGPTLCEQIAARGPAVIVYVACDPAALGRDTAALMACRLPAGHHPILRLLPADPSHRVRRPVPARINRILVKMYQTACGRSPPENRLQRGGDSGVDKIVALATLITAIATAGAAVVGLMRMFRRSAPPDWSPRGTTGEEQYREPPRPRVPPQSWAGTDRPETPPIPKPKSTETSWYQRIPRSAGNSWTPSGGSDETVSPSPVPPQSPRLAHSTQSAQSPPGAIPDQAPPNQWWQGAQSNDRIRAASRTRP